MRLGAGHLLSMTLMQNAFKFVTFSINSSDCRTDLTFPHYSILPGQRTAAIFSQATIETYCKIYFLENSYLFDGIGSSSMTGSGFLEKFAWWRSRLFWKKYFVRMKNIRTFGQTELFYLFHLLIECLMRNLQFCAFPMGKSSLLLLFFPISQMLHIPKNLVMRHFVIFAPLCNFCATL